MVWDSLRVSLRFSSGLGVLEGFRPLRFSSGLGIL